MDMDWKAEDFEDAEQAVYTLADRCFAYLENGGDEEAGRLTDEQHALMAYVYLDSQVQEGGFVQLIASGYGEYVLLNPLADSLRRWKIKPTPKILDRARALYEKYGADIEAAAETEHDLDVLRRRFPFFEELDGDYYDCAAEDMQRAADYIAQEPQKFCRFP